MVVVVVIGGTLLSVPRLDASFFLFFVFRSLSMLFVVCCLVAGSHGTNDRHNGIGPNPTRNGTESDGIGPTRTRKREGVHPNRSGFDVD